MHFKKLKTHNMPYPEVIINLQLIEKVVPVETAGQAWCEVHVIGDSNYVQVDMSFSDLWDMLEQMNSN